MPLLHHRLLYVFFVIAFGHAMASSPHAAASSPHAAGGTTSPQETERWKQAERVLANAPKPEAVRAHYVQTRTSVLLNEPVRSEGRFIAADGVARWSLNTPVLLEMRVDADRMRIYYVADRVVEVYPVTGYALPIAQGRPDLKNLSKNFHLRRVTQDKKLWSMHFEAREAMRSSMLSLVVDFDSAAGVIVSATTTDAAGDLTHIALKDIDTTDPIDADELALNVPADARVVYPAGTGTAGDDGTVSP